MSSRAEVLDRFESFRKGAAIPAFNEIAQTLDRHGKQTTVHYGGTVMDENMEDLFVYMHPKTRDMDWLRLFPEEPFELVGGEAVFRGPSILVYDPEVINNAQGAPGMFCISIMIKLDTELEAFAFPLCMYQMRFDNKLHKFLHRFEQSVPAHRLELVSKSMIQNYFLGAYDFFKIHAGRSERPADF